MFPHARQQFQIWRKNLSGFQIKAEFRKLSDAKLVIDQDYVKNLPGLALNLERLHAPSRLLLEMYALKYCHYILLYSLCLDNGKE